MEFERFKPEAAMPPVQQGIEDGPTPYSRREPGRYQVTDARVVTAVNTALFLGQPLLVTGSPGVGKTTLASAVADVLRWPLYVWAVRSESRVSDELYTFDHLRRLHDAQRTGGTLESPANYRRWGALGAALKAGQAVLLIDEIDKAPRDFPNDLLWLLDQGEFSVPEVPNERIEPPVIDQRVQRPFVLVTSNRERAMPAAFLRRCVFLELPDLDRSTIVRIAMSRIAISKPEHIAILDAALDRADELLKLSLSRTPSLAEKLAWVKALIGANKSAAVVRDEPWRELLPGVLAKSPEDAAVLERQPKPGQKGPSAT